MVVRPARVRLPARGLGAVVAALLALAVLYAVALLLLDLDGAPTETLFGGPAAAADAVHVYLQPIAVDPVNDSIRFEASLTVGYGLGGEAMLADRELTATIGHHAEAVQLTVHVDQPPPAAALTLDLSEGSIADYPFERFHANVHVRCTEGARALPVRVTLWGGLTGWRVQGTEVADTPGGDLTLRLKVRRTGGIAFFGVAAYCSMALVALCGLTISALVFAGVRRIEATLVSALGAMVFALPAIRNALPGAPPLGVRADLFVYLWAQAATVISLALYVLAWARRGPAA